MKWHDANIASKTTKTSSSDTKLFYWKEIIILCSFYALFIAKKLGCLNKAISIVSKLQLQKLHREKFLFTFLFN